MEKYTFIGMNHKNGERLLEFCATEGLVRGGTIFPQKEIHKVTWKSRDGVTTTK